jgi:Flp pilus assembly protein CpaB
VKRSNRLLILLGLLIAVGGALAAVALAGSGGGSGPGATPTPTLGVQVPVVVASTKIAAGTIIDKTMVNTTPKFLSDLTGLGGTTYSNINDVIGKVAGSDIAKDQIIVNGPDLLSPGSALDGKSLSDSIDKGYVAISMEIDQTNGVGTLIVPGDRVDIILTTYVTSLSISVKDALGTQISTGGAAVTSKLILQNCKILQTLLPPPVTTSGAAPVAGASPKLVAGPTSAVVQFTDRHMIAIIEVTPEQSQVIRWAQRLEGQSPQTYIDLAFALRSSQDDATDPMSSNPFKSIPGVTFSEIVAKYGVLPPDPLSALPPLLGGKIQW